VPKALGGPNIPWNYVRSCGPCNVDKGSNWPDCPCGVCALAVEMFLWWKERGGGHTLAVSAVEMFRQRLWDERIGRMELWEDAPWINAEHFRAKRVERAIRRRMREREDADTGDRQS
jgi:hypothetical protein